MRTARSGSSSTFSSSSRYGRTASSGHWSTARTAATRTRRRAEARAAARLLGAEYHPSLTDDLEILYERPLLRRLAALPRVDIAYSHAGADGTAVRAFLAAGARRCA